MFGFNPEAYNACVTQLEKTLAENKKNILQYLANLSEASPPFNFSGHQILILKDGDKKLPVLKTKLELGHGSINIVYVSIPLIKTKDVWILDCEHPVAIRESKKRQIVSKEHFDARVQAHRHYYGSCPALQLERTSYMQVPIEFGEDMFTYIEDQRIEKEDKKDSFEKRLNIGIELLEKYIELFIKRGLVHRDIKPENIFINPLSFIDVDSLRNIDEKPIEIAGTYTYVDPTCIKDRNNFSYGTDIYSLIITFLEILGISIFSNKQALADLYGEHKEKKTIQEIVGSVKFTSGAKEKNEHTKKTLTKMIEHAIASQQTCDPSFMLRLINAIPFDEHVSFALTTKDQEKYHELLSKIVATCRNILSSEPSKRVEQLHELISNMRTVYQCIAVEEFKPSETINHSRQLPSNIVIDQPRKKLQTTKRMYKAASDSSLPRTKKASTLSTVLPGCRSTKTSGPLHFDSGSSAMLAAGREQTVPMETSKSATAAL